MASSYQWVETSRAADCSFSVRRAVRFFVAIAFSAMIGTILALPLGFLNFGIVAAGRLREKRQQEEFKWRMEMDKSAQEKEVMATRSEADFWHKAPRGMSRQGERAQK